MDGVGLYFDLSLFLYLSLIVSYSLCNPSKSLPQVPHQLSAEEREVRYDTCLCNLLSTLYERGEHKETYLCNLISIRFLFI